MRSGWLGLVAVVALMASCGGDEQPQPPPPPPPPPPATYKLGGTVSGLAGSLTLQLNGAENLVRTADGAFTFQTELDDGSAYSVALTASPAEQDCTLQGATGTVSGADVTSLSVTCTTRTYSLGGTLEGLSGTLALSLDGGETLSLTTNGAFTFQGRRPKGSSYAVTLGTAPRGSRCALTHGTGTVDGNVQNITVRCTPWFTLTTFQPATVVLGQSNFTSSASHRGGTPSAATLDGPWGNPVLAGGKLYVSDSTSNRILGFNALPSQSGQAADFVLGQPDFTTLTAGTGRGGLYTPEGGASDGSRLVVADKINNRVLLYNPLPASTGAEPALVIGQPNFTTTDFGCAPGSLTFPEDAFIGHGKLVVADTANNRVLIWNSVPGANGAPADLVLGQSSLTRCAANDTNGDGTGESNPSASTLSAPSGVWTDGTRLLVADTSNNRVLLWNSFPTTPGQAADVVLGQTSFTARGSALTATGMNAPTLVNSTGTQLFIAEYQNGRVTVWNQFPTANGAAPDLVLGQPTFTSRTRFDPPTSTSPSARSLYQPSGILLAAPYVVITDSGNNRLLIYESQ